MSKSLHTVFIVIIVVMLILAVIVPEHRILFGIIGAAVAVVSLIVMHRKR